MGRETAEQKAERLAAEVAEREAAEAAAAEQAAKDAAEVAATEAAEAAAAEQAAKDAAAAAALDQAEKDAAAASAAAEAAAADDREIVVATMRINGTILTGTIIAPDAEHLAELRALSAVRDASEDEKAVYRLTNPPVDDDLIV